MAYFYIGSDLVDIINLSDRSYTVETVVQEQSADKVLNIYISGFNKVNQKRYARLTTTVGRLEAVTRSKRTLTLSLDRDGASESLEDCLNNRKGIQINTICTSNPE